MREIVITIRIPIAAAWFWAGVLLLALVLLAGWVVPAPLVYVLSAIGGSAGGHMMAHGWRTRSPE